MNGWTIAWCVGCMILLVLAISVISENNKLREREEWLKYNAEYWYDKFANAHMSFIKGVLKGGDMKKNQGKLEMRQSTDTQWYFVMIASNGKIMGMSEMYTTKFNCKKAMLAFEKYEWKIKEVK